MNLERNLRLRLEGAKMIIIGTAGIISNEIDGAISGEVYTTTELNQLPKGYILRGFGYLTKNNSIISKGRNMIREYRLKKKIKQSIFST